MTSPGRSGLYGVQTSTAFTICSFMCGSYANEEKDVCCVVTGFDHRMDGVTVLQATDLRLAFSNQTSPPTRSSFC